MSLDRLTTICGVKLILVLSCCIKDDGGGGVDDKDDDDYSAWNQIQDLEC